MYKKYKPSKKKKEEFKKQIQEISQFCIDNNIKHSLSYDSYYFTINNKEYRVSNHTIEKSNEGCFNEFGDKIRNSYHEYDNPNMICITASKTRIIEIYNNLKNGVKLNKRGYKL